MILCYMFDSFLSYVGANASIRNNEKQLAYDLSAKNPEVGRLLMVRGKNFIYLYLLCVQYVFMLGNIQNLKHSGIH